MDGTVNNINPKCRKTVTESRVTKMQIHNKISIGAALEYIIAICHYQKLLSFEYINTSKLKRANFEAGVAKNKLFSGTMTTVAAFNTEPKLLELESGKLVGEVEEETDKTETKRDDDIAGVGGLEGMMGWGGKHPQLWKQSFLV